MKALPASLKLTVPLILLAFAVDAERAQLHLPVPGRERAVEEDHRESACFRSCRGCRARWSICCSRATSRARGARWRSSAPTRTTLSCSPMTKTRHRSHAASLVGAPGDGGSAEVRLRAGAQATRAWCAGGSRSRREFTARLRRYPSVAARSGAARIAHRPAVFEYDLRHPQADVRGQIVAQSLYRAAGG